MLKINKINYRQNIMNKLFQDSKENNLKNCKKVN